MEYRC